MSKHLTVYEWRRVDAAVNAAIGSLRDAWNRSGFSLPHGTRSELERLIREGEILRKTIQSNAERLLGLNPTTPGEDASLWRWGNGQESGYWARCIGSETVCDGRVCLLAMARPDGAMVIHPLDGRPNMVQVRYEHLKPLNGSRFSIQSHETKPIDLEREGWTEDVLKEASTWAMDMFARAVLLNSLQKRTREACTQ